MLGILVSILLLFFCFCLFLFGPGSGHFWTSVWSGPRSGLDLVCVCNGFLRSLGITAAREAAHPRVFASSAPAPERSEGDHRLYIEELITSLHTYIVSGLWDPPGLARFPLVPAGSHTPFSDPVSELVSEPFRTRFWSSFSGLFEALFRSLFGACSLSGFVLSSWSLGAYKMAPGASFGLLSGRFRTARRPKNLVKYSVFVRFQWSAKAAM